jgi:hypothetical protein
VGEQDGRFDPLSGFLDAMRQDTVLSLVKLIAEPWIGPDGYHFGVPATGRNGTTAFVLQCGVSGKAMTASPEKLHYISSGRATA